MDIKTNGSSPGLNPYLTQVNKQPEKADAAEPAEAPNRAQAKGDEVTLSSKAKEITRAQQALEEVPDVNMDKVKELKNQVENGTYQMDPGRIANAMLGDMLTTQIKTE
jgi:negative regulator of flagellin synthesis FlgM